MTAKDGYFKAKREMVEAIDRRVIFLNEQVKDLEASLAFGNWHRETISSMKSQIHALEGIRDFVRNVMLWKNEETV